ncbi:hypothetical protein A0257_14565 [Hymenobacter psoromatis]|nr:hypothetical protein A0257_14565 [Hymenobacter psoromatis]
MQEQLQAFAASGNYAGKGPLCVFLVMTEQVKNRPWPLAADDFLTEQGGQVLGLGKSAVQAILRRHGITQVLAQEGGRTSRGSIATMRDYLSFLNELHQTEAVIDWPLIEAFWIAKVRDFFTAKPLRLSMDASQSVRTMIRQLIQQAVTRQREQPGATLVGTLMQHLVGAKLTVINIADLQHHSANQNDQDASRTGDFDIGDVSLHVTSSPTESLLLKCQANLAANRRPLIVTLSSGVIAAQLLAENIGIADRLDIIDFEQFMAANIHEHSRFDLASRRTVMQQLVAHYNSLIETFEGGDGRLKIALA